MSKSEERLIRKICVIGLWHQASVVSACFADMGHQVCAVGDDVRAVAFLNAGRAPVYEPELEAILLRNLQAGRLRYTTDYREALTGAEFAYICIDTPVGPDDESDLGPIQQAVERVADGLSGDLILCMGAQVPVGTCHQMAKILATRQPDRHIPVVYVPEFLRLGSAVETFRKADRFAIGSDDPAVATRVAELYKPLARPIILTDLRSAEMAKHACNTFLAVSISFINEIADLCEEVGADVLDVVNVMKFDRRIGPYAFLSPGLGFAGGTLGREIRALQRLGRTHKVALPLLEAVGRANETRARLVSNRLLRIHGDLRARRVGILGLTYKAGTSTLRRSIALDIIRNLVANGALVSVYDPLARLDEEPDLPKFEVCADPYQVAQGSDALVLVTEWSGIQNMDLTRLAAIMRDPIFIDTRNLFSPVEMIQAGFRYYGIGRGMHHGQSVS